MSVYVDDWYQQATVPNGRARHTSRWCHMMADTREELDAMAVKIGLKIAWRQHSGEVIEHYDLTLPKRAAALRAGAIEITWRDGAALTNRKIALRDGQPVDGDTFAEQLGMHLPVPTPQDLGPTS